MPFCLIIDAYRTDAPPSVLADQAGQALLALYPDHQLVRKHWPWCWVLTAQKPGCGRQGWVTGADGHSGLLAAGTWFYADALASGQEAELLAQANAHGFEAVLDRLDGVFCVASVNDVLRQVDIAVDPAGSYHVYQARQHGLLLVSDSALLLAALTGAALNADAVLQFVATAVIYGPHSLWQGLAKLPPAGHLQVNALIGGVNLQTYWHCNRIQPERYGLDEATDRLAQALTQTAKVVGGHFPGLLADLTGGYDSRVLLLGFLLAKVPVSTTVSGADSSADAQVAQAIARQFGLPHRRVERNEAPTYAALAEALRLTDGEFNVFEYARIAATHHGHLAAGHSLSVNGSFGELARGYWWELLLPRLGARKAVSPLLLAKKRFAAEPYQQAVFVDELTRERLLEGLVLLLRQYGEEMAGFPNTTQLDYLYLVMRMQRWQGRIASATNRIWPAVSPFAFRPLLQVMLEAKAGARFRNLLVRTLFANHLPALGRIPLEHGYPAMPVNLGNLLSFTPVLGHYAERIRNRLFRRWQPAPPPPSAKRYGPLFADPLFKRALAAEHLAASGLFKIHELYPLMENAHRSPQGQRLITLEMALQTVSALRAQPQQSQPPAPPAD